MDLDIFDAAMGQTMSARGIAPQTVCSSTHHNPDGTFTEVLKRASERDWPVFEWCYRENLQKNGGWLEDAEVERKRREVPKAMFLIEYDLQKPSPKTRAIDPECVKALFDKELGEYRGVENKEIRIVEPFHLLEFYTGTDWARDEDWTIIHTMEETATGQPDKLAAWKRMGRRPWPHMIEAHNSRVHEYGGPSEHDATGVGEVCDDFLTVDSVGFDFRHRKNRDEMLANYIAAIESGKLIYPMIEYAFLEHLYATTNDLYGSGHLPDTISAAALSWRAKEYSSRTYDPSNWNTVRR